MPREVVRVFTAGTVIEPGMLEAERNNYLAAVVFEDGRAGLAYADITTGEFATTQLNGQPTNYWRSWPGSRPGRACWWPRAVEFGFSTRAIKTISPLPAWRFELGNARQTLCCATSSVSTPRRLRLRAEAAGDSRRGRAVLHYLQETQRGRVDQMQRLTTYATDGYMALSGGHAPQPGTD
jgi:DNA mismatch repair protein MutS